MKKTQIIAEIGVNHNGKIQIAKKLIDQAKQIGADIVKFQVFKAEELSIEKAKMAQYQKKQLKKTTSQLQMLKKLELTFDEHKKLMLYSKKKKIKYLASVFDLESFYFIKKYCKIIKLPSGEINNFLLLNEISKSDLDVIISSGASKIFEIDRAINILKRGKRKRKIIILHCNSEYPSLNLKDINLRAMKYMGDRYNIDYGYSDHSLDDLVSTSAVTLGAKVIEKHFTLNKKQKGPDHQASLNPKEFKNFIKNIRKVEKILGSKIKKISLSEKKNRSIIRKSIVAKCEIKKGEKFSLLNLTLKRPGKGMDPFMLKKLLKSKSKKNYTKDEFIT